MSRTLLRTCYSYEEKGAKIIVTVMINVPTEALVRVCVTLKKKFSFTVKQTRTKGPDRN